MRPALLTLIARPAILGPVPAFLFDANTPGTGKSLQADTIATIAIGRGAGRHNYPQDARNADEELCKAIGGYAMAGAGLITFDNIEGGSVFGGPTIEACLTASDNVSFRVLGRSEGVTAPWCTVIMGSGNNMHPVCPVIPTKALVGCPPS